MKIAILISANAEWNPVKSIVKHVQIKNYPFGEWFNIILRDKDLMFFHSGWGKISSAGALQYVIDHYDPDLIINLGTCGGLAGVVSSGDLILVERTVVYDIVELMEGTEIAEHYASSLDLSWLIDPLPHPARRGTLASADSDLLPEKAAFLKAKGAIAADWESGALAWVAQRNNAPLLILRVVSDVVSEQGGEVYNDIEAFNDRTEGIMKRLIDQLPGWLDAVKLP